MATPIATFTYLISNLQVNFTDLTLNNPTSWLWEFGDSNTSSLQNPIHTYSVPGTYEVKLTATNLDGSSEVMLQLLVSVPTTLFVEDYIQVELPVGLVLEDPYKTRRIQYWQVYLQTLINPPIPTPSIHDDTAWPSLVNVLIAKLVVFDACMHAAKGAMVFAWNSASSQDSGQGTTPSPQGTGQIKSIETGPAKVEWHDASNLLNSMFKASGDDGLSVFDTIKQSTCQLAKRVRVYLPMCGELENKPLVYKKATKEEPSNADEIFRKTFPSIG